MNNIKKGLSFAFGFWIGTGIAYFGAKMLDEYLIHNNDNYREWRGVKSKKGTVSDTDDENDIFDEEVAAEWDEPKS